MPELPEVEITRRRIAPLLLGRRIADVHTTADSYFFLTPPAELARGLEGREIRSVYRRGKYLLAELCDGQHLLLHLGMSGQLFADGASSIRLLSATTRAALAPDEQPGFEPDVHTHLRLSFADGGSEVLFRDVRKFGKVRLLAPGESDPRLDKLGVDALEVTGEDLHAGTRRAGIARRGGSAVNDRGTGSVRHILSYIDSAARPSRARNTNRIGISGTSNALRNTFDR